MPRHRLSRVPSTASTDSSRVSLALSELRTRFGSESIRRYSPLDVQRLLREEWWLGSFLLSHSCDVDVTLAVVKECLKWRMQFQVEHIGMLSVKELLDRRFMYIHGYDVERNSILWICLREHSTGQRDSERLFVYWMERHFNDTKAAPLTILIDMTSTSLVNMDYNLFKFILHSLKYYYPNCVQDMLVFESPSILNAAWKVIRSWLDPAHPQLQLVTRDSLPQFVSRDSLPAHMGGHDPFEFSMEELARCIPSRDAITEEILYENGSVDAPQLDSFPIKRTVKFESEEEEATRKTPLVLGGANVRRTSKGPSNRRSTLPSALRPIAERRVHAPATEWAEDAFLSVCPREELSLIRLEDDTGTTDLVDVVAVRNTSDAPFLFKIKTTSPEKFRVRPSAGRVAAGSTEIVRLYLQNEYRMTAGKEKFLLMALQTESVDLDNFSQLWGNASPEARAEHKLRCRVQDEEGATVTTNGGQRKSAAALNEVESLRLEVAALSSTQRLLGFFIAFLVLLQIVCILNERSNNASLRLAIETLAAAAKSNNPSFDL